MFNQQTVAQNNATTVTPPDTTPRVTEEILELIKNDTTDSIFYVSSSPATNKLYSFLKEIYDLNPKLLRNDNDYPIATCVGITYASGILSYLKTNRNLAKLTYLLAFRVSFKKIITTQNNQAVTVSYPQNFETWWAKANGLRLVDWSKKASTPGLITTYGPIIKRLTKNGEEEVWTETEVPVSETSPAIAHHLNNTKSKYQYLGIALHKQIEPTFFVNNVSQVRIPYFLKAQVEAPFYPVNESWVGFCRSFPYNVVSNNGIPYPTSGFTQIVINNIKTKNIFDQLVDTAVFFPAKKKSVANYRQFPVVDSVVTGNAIAILNGKLKINAFKKTKVYVSINVTTGQSTYILGKNITIRENGDIYSGSNIINQEYTTNKYNPNIFTALDYKDLKIYYESASGRFYINELEPITLYADYVLAETVDASDLIGHRIYKENNQYFIQVSSSTAIGNNVDDEVLAPATYILGTSGITIGIGIDIGNTFDNPNLERRTEFENIILTNNCPNWVSMLATDKAIIQSAYTIKQSAAQNIWLRNIVLFNKLDLQINNSSYYNVLKDCAEFARKFYYNAAINKLVAKGLKADLNVGEEFAVLTIMYNSETAFNDSARANNFVEAINNHSHAKLVAAVNSLSSTIFSKVKVIERLNTPYFKRYYNDFHFHNLTFII